MPHEETLKQLEERRAFALAMGGEERLERHRSNGNLDARARLAHLFDDGAMVESGMHARSARAEVRDKSPADGKVAGFGKVDGRWVAAMSNDFTVMGASSALINGKKMRHLKHVANTQGMPLIWMGESTGARMPDRMGAS
ncbi:MAG: carboxyl transferase domain-containing protein, partial [Pseudomonadota bacterium]|nr:carboxyl transferase domain-containing protein [Pseudomonadota bacterium]